MTAKKYHRAARKTVGIIGFGSFGKLMTRHLAGFFDVSISSSRNIAVEARKLGAKAVSLQEAASKEIVILSVPVQAMEKVLKQIRPFVKPGALIMDVCSVKVVPVKLMKRYLPSNVSILGAHPLFGPQSGKDGIKGFKIVLCPVRCDNLASIKSFLSKRLELNVMIKTPVQHDKEMAYVQALTHFLSHELKSIIPAGISMGTKSFDHLLSMHELLKNDSEELFLAIQRENKFSHDVRKKLLRRLELLDRKINGNNR